MTKTQHRREFQLPPDYIESAKAQILSRTVDKDSARRRVTTRYIGISAAAAFILLIALLYFAWMLPTQRYREQSNYIAEWTMSKGDPFIWVEHAQDEELFSEYMELMADLEDETVAMQ